MWPRSRGEVGASTIFRGEYSVLELTAVIGDYPHTRPLLDGTVTSDLVSIKFVEYKPINRAFAPMLGDQEFDVCEMAVSAFLQAVEFGKNVTMLPVPMMCGVHHGSLVHVPRRGRLRPADLSGRRIGIRAYAQTTGLWLRGVLEEEHGIAAGDVEWVVLEESHVREYVDPPFVTRAGDGIDLLELLESGAVDAAVGAPAGREVRAVIPAAAAAERAWFDRYGTVAVNHVVSMRADLAASRPDAALELYRMFARAREIGLPGIRHAFDDSPRLAPIGLDGVRASLELAVRLALRQRLIRTAPAVLDLVPACLAS